MNFANFKSFIHKIVPSMPVGKIEQFSSKSIQKEIKKGDLFVKEGDVCRHLLFIHHGLFRYCILHEGRDLTKDFAVDGHNPFCTAYTSFIFQKPSDLWIEALEPSVVWIWPEKEVRSLFDEDPLWLSFSKKMADLLILRKERKELELMKCSAEERYRHFLSEFPGLSQRVPQYHIASYLGITPESLSRIRARGVNTP